MKSILFAVFLFSFTFSIAQNSMVADGFGGRLWYNPTNYAVGSYSAYSICTGICDTLDNQLYGWGDNQYNQLGLGQTIQGVSIPTLIPNMTDVKYYTAGYICGAIKNDGTGWAFGDSITGNPVQILSNAYFLDASSDVITYVKNDGTVWSIGNNSMGAFGDGTSGNFSKTIPVQMQGITNAVRVATTFANNLILLSDSTLMAVGFNFAGMMGLGSSVSSTLVPLPVPGLPKIIDVKANTGGTIALAANGDVWAFGRDGNNVGHDTPYRLTSLNNIVSISGCEDGYYFYFLDADKNCYSWGLNNHGQCGMSNSTNRVVTPTIVATDVVDVMAGELLTYIVKSDGSLWATGTSNQNRSIWLNLPDIERHIFTQMDPSLVPTACEVLGIIPYLSCENSTYTLTISNFGGQAPYTYSIGSSFQTSNVFTNLIVGNTYAITVRDINGCEYTTTTTIYPDNCFKFPASNDTEVEEEFSITFPNVFTPNGDGENDLFYFPNTGVISMKVQIYNRWGQLIFKSDQLNQGWDGRTTAGVSCSDGTYYYIVSYKEKSESDWETSTGYISLLR